MPLSFTVNRYIMSFADLSHFKGRPRVPKPAPKIFPTPPPPDVPPNRITEYVSKAKLVPSLLYVWHEAAT